MNNINVLFEQLKSQLNQYISGGSAVFSIEKEIMLRTCRDLYAAVDNLAVKSESYQLQANVVSNNDEQIALISAELASLRHQLTASLDTIKSIASSNNNNGFQTQNHQTQPQPEPEQLTADDNEIASEENTIETIANDVESHLDKAAIDQYAQQHNHNHRTTFEYEQPAEEPEITIHNPIEQAYKDKMNLATTAPNNETQTEVETQKRTLTTSGFSIEDVIANAEDGSALLNNLRFRPIENLKKGIGLNEKFLYIRELFENNHSSFAAVIDKINAFENLKQAETYLAEEVLPNQKWNLNDETVVTFFSVIYRRFL